MIDVAIIGGGAAGYFAAINIKRKHPGLKIEIFEKSKNVLAKVKISGGGRCNVTHACFDINELVKYYPRGKKELHSVFKRFNPHDTIAWFEKEGIKLKTETDGRMFPESDHSETIVDCLEENCRMMGIAVNRTKAVQEISKKEDFVLLIQDKEILARKVIIATGSSEYSWNLIAKLGHRIITPVPSLFTFNINHPLLNELMGLSLPKATIYLKTDKSLLKKYALQVSDIEQSGPLLITHWGLSGPAILKLSSIAARLLNELQYRFEIELNFANLGFDDTLSYIRVFKEANYRKQVINTPLFGIPQRWWQRIHALTFENTYLTWSDISKKEMQKLSFNLSGFNLKVDGKSTFKEEFVTAGGVDLKEVNFKTMESKIVPGLYFAGEVLDIDALTGGFNFQAAWSEAWVLSEAIDF